MDEVKVGEEKTTPETSEKTPEELSQEKIESDDLRKREEQLANVNKAIAEANEELRKVREAKRSAKKDDISSEELKIDLDDPNSKAWDKHIKEKVEPVALELEKEKEEIRTFALQEFLSDKPSLASNPEKIKEVVGVYEKIRTASERTKEGVVLDLRKAYAAVFHEQLTEQANKERVDKAKADAAFSDVAINKGSTSYSIPKEANPKLSDDDKAVLAKWGIKPEEWAEEYKKQRAKE